MPQFFFESNQARFKANASSLPREVYIPVNLGRASGGQDDPQGSFTDGKPNLSIKLTEWLPYAINQGYLTLPGATAEGIDDTLAIGQALTANRTINLNTNDLIVTGGEIQADQVSVLDGDLANPGFRFVGSGTGTGFYAVGASNQISVALGGAQAWKFANGQGLSFFKNNKARYYNSTDTFYAGVQAPSALAASYNLTWFNTVPTVDDEFVTLSSTGQFSTSPGINVQENNTIRIFDVADTTHAAMELYAGGHDLGNLSYDAYWNGSQWVSSDVGSNFQIIKFGDQLLFRFDSGNAAGGGIAWNTAIQLETTGAITIPSTSTIRGVGAAAAPLYSFASNTNTGIYNSFGGSIGFSCAGVFAYQMHTNAFNVRDNRSVRIFDTADTTHAAMELYAGGHDNVAVSFDAYWNGTNWISSDLGSNFQLVKTGDKLVIRVDDNIAAGGTITWSDLVEFGFSNAVVRINQGLSVSTGSVGAPSLRFNDPNTGFYAVSADQIGVTNNGALTVLYNSAFTRLDVPLRLTDADQSNHAEITVPTAVTSNYVITLPAAGPSNTGDYLSDTDGAGTMEWKSVNEGTLTDGANISWNLDTAHNANVTLGGNRTLDNPTNMRSGRVHRIRVIQDGTPPRTLSYGTAYKFPGGTAPTLSTGAGDIDLLTFYTDGTNMYLESSALNLS